LVDTGTGTTSLTFYQNTSTLAYQFGNQTGKFFIYDAVNTRIFLQMNATAGLLELATAGTVNVNIGTSGTNTTIGGQIFVPNIATSSAAQSGTVCWASGGSPAGKFTADTTLGCLTSSERFKNVVGEVPPEDCLAMVLKLRAVSFYKKREFGGDLDPAEQIGFLAEDVDRVDRRLTAMDADGQVRGVRYQQDSAIYACAIQQVVKDLKADNDNLRAEIGRLQRGGRL
jgi:hypothetical protein